MNILPGLVPLQVADDCVDALPVNCGDGGVSSNNVDSSFKIEFPRSTTTLPLSGGAVISIGARDLKLNSSLNVANVLTRGFSVLQGLNFNNNLEDLVKSRVAVNNALFDIARRDLKVVDEKDNKKKAPSIYLALFKGEDASVIEDGIFNPDLIRVCEFRFIPVESFAKILDNLVSEENPEFGEVVGVSGRTYQSLKDLADELAESVNQQTNSVSLSDVEAPTFPSVGGDEADIVDLVLEFFPIVNISSSSLASQENSPIIGGYYTILDGTLYIKLPDLSGRNSLGESSGLITEDSSLWVEILSGAVISRIEIEDFKAPPLATFVGGQQTEFPFLSTLDITFELAEEESVRVYLSPIVKNISVPKRRSIEPFSNSLELFSLPLLTKPIQSSGGRLATIREDSFPPITDAAFSESEVRKYYPNFNGNFENTGFPYLGQVDAHTYFGEGNRPDIILSGDGELSNKNDDRYFSLASAGVLEILSSIRPRIYEDVPSTWVSAVPSQDLDGNYVAKFFSSDFDDIDLVGLNGTIEFAVYVGDSLGQITKVSGPNLKLSDLTPAITRISSDGFNGSSAIVIADDNIIQISGEDLANVQQITFTGQTAGDLIVLIPGDGIMSTPTNTSITLDFTSQSMSSKGFVSGQTYIVVLQGSGSDLTSQEDAIYVVSSEDDSRPVKGGLVAKFKDEEISSDQFGRKPVVGIPLFKNGTSAVIGIKSKSKLFQGDKEVFAYFAIPNTNANASRILSQFSFPDKTATITTQVGELLVPIDLEYQFSTSVVSDFAKSITSNRKASLQFPGNTYAHYNFSGLQNLEKGYFLFTGVSLAELLGSGTTLTLANEDHGVLELGGDDGPAFIEPSNILGFAADIGGETVFSSFSGNPFSIPENVFNTTSFTPGLISVYNKINRLALVVSGVKEKFLRKRYQFNFGGTDISNKISKDPIVVSSGKLLFVLDNITPTVDGILDFTIDKKEKNFGFNYSTTNYISQATAVINGAPGTSYTIDTETGILTLNTEISGDSLISDLSDFLDNGTSGIIGFSNLETNLAEALYPDSETDGLIFDPRFTQDGTFYTAFNPLDITSTTNLKLGFNSQDLTDQTSLISGIKEEDISGIQRSVLSVSSGSVFLPGSYLLNEDKTAVLLFFGTTIDGLASVKYNVPEVISIGEEDQEPILLSTGQEIPIGVGKKYKVLVKNTDRDFVIKLDEIIVKPRGRPEPTNNPGEYIATIEAPAALLLTNDCFEICASTENAIRNRAKFELGRDFVIDLDEIFQDMLLGPLKDKIPDIQGLFDRLADAPLRFVQLLLDKANIPKDLIKSFCDLSFHLLAELKISLNGLRILMIPIQVIFCIIDVICSLMNPIKVAKAVIRLFQCLYDLILLLPMISIPVMFLQLILHLLELLKCVIDKILFTITAINEISRAINLASQKPINFTAIKALEETLSEYLFEIDADLSFLEPILSILAIFLQLLQLLFRFPCSIDPGGGQADCGVDGTLLAGIVAGLAAPDSVIVPEVMIPIAQTYSTDSDEGSTEDAFLVEAAVGNIVASDADGTFLESMTVDEDSLRGTTSGTGSIDFNATLAPTFTKSRKNAGKPTEVEFQFKSKALSTFLNSKNIDPNQTVDAPIAFFDQTGGNLVVAANGNLYSPVDGEAFLNINGSTASVKPLVLDLEIPTFTTDETTGIPVQTGTETVSRTFDNIPKMVLMDDEFNVYFIKQNGIEFNDDGFVEKITAEIVNTAAAPKLKFSREDVELDTDDDTTTDDGTLQVFDFPQLYFFDMREAGEQLQQFCSTASINSFPFEDNNTDDITEIVQESQDCLQTYLTEVRSMVSDLRTAQQGGQLPLGEMSTDTFDSLNTTLIDCLNGSVNKICKFVVNSLNTSFKIVEDLDETPLEEFTDGDISPEVLDGFEEIGPAFTGAREYAAGIGDSANVVVGDSAHIEVIPRDSYDEEIIGDLTRRINVEIISDTTGTASFIRNNGNIFTKNGTSYFAELTASQIGEVKLRARICDRTIQALTFSGLEDEVETTAEIDCVPDNLSEIINASPPLGALTKVDRILTIFFIQASQVVLSENDGGGAELPNTYPQAFGSGLEN